MKKIDLLFLVIVISSFTGSLFAQKIFREGYIVKNSGESLTGLVGYSAKHGMPSVCTFKRFDIARTIVYSPGEIQAFGYWNGNRYESGEINGKMTYLEVIITGKIVLYQKGSRYFIEKDHSGLIELGKGPFSYHSDEGNKEFRSLSEFLTFLTEGKAGSVPENFSAKNEIIPLITDYNKVSGAGYNVFNRSISEKQLSQQTWKSGANENRIGFVGGVNLYMLNQKLTPAMYRHPWAHYVPDPEKETGPVFGITYERLLSRRTDRFSARVDLLYNSQNFYCYGERSNNAGGTTTRDDANFNFKGIKVPLLIQYSFTGGRIVPYVNAGISYQYFIQTDYYHVYEIEDIMHEITTYEDRNMLFKTGELSGVGGVGVRARISGKLNLHLMLMVEAGQGIFLNKDPTDVNLTGNKPYIQNSIQSSLLLGITF